MSTNLTAVLEELLQNTTNLKVLRQLMTTDAMDVSYPFGDCISLILKTKSMTEEWVTPLLKMLVSY
jgi:hypothetical protein